MVLAGAALAAGFHAMANSNDYTAITRGRYLVTAGDCVACHQNDAGDLAGGRGIETPFGTIRAANITPDRETGIGTWSADDFARALHEGLAPGGRRLYPAFPYAFYTRITREDADAIYAWLRSIPPVRNVVDRDTLPFPLNIRTVMRGWNALFFEPGRFQPAPGRSEEWNRGAYLVTGLGHCGACHTPVNVLGASRAGEALAGQPLQGWFAPNISANGYQGIGAWGVDDIVQYLRTGATGWTRASGPMAEVVEFSTSRMTDADLRAIAVYLKDQPSRGVATAPVPLAAGIPSMRAGAAIFTDNCAACHGGNGRGVEGLIPSLTDNQIVLQHGAETLGRVVISGVRAMATDADPTAPGMPSFGWRLNDAQVADVLTYMRNTWGNAAPAVEAATISGMRTQLGGLAP